MGSLIFAAKVRDRNAKARNQPCSLVCERCSFCYVSQKSLLRHQTQKDQMKLCKGAQVVKILLVDLEEQKWTPKILNTTEQLIIDLSCGLGSQSESKPPELKAEPNLDNVQEPSEQMFSRDATLEVQPLCFETIVRQDLAGTPPNALVHHEAQISLEKYSQCSRIAENQPKTQQVQCVECLQRFTTEQLNKHQRKHKKDCIAASFVLKVILCLPKCKNLLNSTIVSETDFNDFDFLLHTLWLNSSGAPLLYSSQNGIYGPLV